MGRTPAVGEDAARGAARECTRRVLEERAHALARPLAVEEPAGTVEIIVMAVGGERYGVEAHHVHEVIALPEVTRVPGTPAFWRGIVNVRGTLRPVLDLRRYLSLADDDDAEGLTSVVLVAGAGRTVGLLVDGAPEIRRLPAAEIGPPLAGAAQVAHRVVRGITSELCTVLDVDALLADTRLAVREEPHDDPA
jgi:purine-binding chemotaxis protein CheW